MNHSRNLRHAAAAAALLAAMGLSACGGGGNSAPTSASGIVNVAVTDAATPDFDNVWITIKEIRFHRLDSASSNDADWLVYPLATPVTIDLAQLNNGALAQVFGNLQLPVGTYRQIRLKLADEDAPLLTSAQAKGLTWNAQVNFMENNVARTAPLEIAGVRDGVALLGSFTVSAAKPLNLVVDFDLDHDVIRLPNFGTLPIFALKPILRYFDLDQAGAIVGRVDPATLQSQSNPNGAYNLIVKAEELAADGSRRVVARATTVKPDGSFTLYPLNVPASATSKNYDVLLRGRNMQTMIVRNVTVTRGTTPTSNPANVSAAAIALTSGTEYTVTTASAMNPTGSWLQFYQTLPGANEVPYEVRFRHVNPYSGDIPTAFAFPLSTGNLYKADWNNGNALSFSAVTPQEGTGNFTVTGKAFQYARQSVTVANPGAGANVALSVPTLNVDAAVATPSSITFNITRLSSNYDRGQLVVTRLGSIVNTQSIDSVLTGNGGAITMSNLPGGASSALNPGAVYFSFVRLWSSTGSVRPRIVPVLGLADLRTASSAAVNVTLP